MEVGKKGRMNLRTHERPGYLKPEGGRKGRWRWAVTSSHEAGQQTLSLFQQDSEATRI